MLKTASLQAFQDGIALEDLPGTLRDAVEVTRAMGIKFLWVDALCILQDSEANVSHELARMQHYYRNALLATSPRAFLAPRSVFCILKTAALLP